MILTARSVSVYSFPDKKGSFSLADSAPPWSELSTSENVREPRNLLVDFVNRRFKLALVFLINESTRAAICSQQYSPPSGYIPGRTPQWVCGGLLLGLTHQAQR